MKKRTFILGATFGTLLLTAAHMPMPLGPDGDSPSLSNTSPENGSDSTAFKRLSAAYASTSSRSTESPVPPPAVEDATLWLARAIYSETKLPHEQELVAWVVRNRVETAYRGNSTYREVVLDPYQFSAFNPGSSKRSFLKQLRPDTPLDGWQQALWVARYVRHADPVFRPFPVETRHFYSERSMEKRRAPYWAEGSRFVPHEARQYAVDEYRFRFFKRVS